MKIFEFFWLIILLAIVNVTNFYLRERNRVQMTLILIQNDPLTLITLRFLSNEKFLEIFILLLLWGVFFFIKCKSENPIRKVVYFFCFVSLVWSVWLVRELSYFMQFPLCLVMLWKYKYIMKMFSLCAELFPPENT